jgi:hypothetical protein
MKYIFLNRWIAARIIDWPLEHCLGCRERVLVGQTFIDVTNGSARARFHCECHPVWLVEQEKLARKNGGILVAGGRLTTAGLFSVLQNYAPWGMRRTTAR